ncbi:MAG: alpha/beta hydrolase [Planctomycetes bacterium]|nr:alpha/beta hydrolase [Planctomycetota bacterium]
MSDKALVGARASGIILWMLVGLMAVGCASCGDLRLAGYRDDVFLKEYTYALGENYLQVGDLKYCYQEMGQGEDVLILPGLGTNIDFWQENIPVLAQHYHVVAVDPPGFGKSDKPDVSYELSWIVDRVVDFMDAKGLQRVSIVGGSMGGHLGLIMALKHPDRVAKLVLMGSVGDWPPPTGMTDFALKHLWNDALCVDVLRERWPEIYAKMFKYETPMTERIFRYQMALRANKAAYAAEGRTFSRSLLSIFYSSCRDRLGEVACPVLLVWGAEDTIHPPTAGENFRDHLPDARLVVVSDSGHEVMVDQKDIFDDLLLEFFRYGTHPPPAVPLTTPCPDAG